MFQMLEDNQVTLSIMKASRCMKAFEKEIDRTLHVPHPGDGGDDSSGAEAVDVT